MSHIEVSNFTHKVPQFKGCAVTLNQVSWSKVKDRAELCDNPCLGHIFSPLGPLWLILHPESAFGQRVCNDL